MPKRTYKKNNNKSILILLVGVLFFFSFRKKKPATIVWDEEGKFEFPDIDDSITDDTDFSDLDEHPDFDINDTVNHEKYQRQNDRNYVKPISDDLEIRPIQPIEIDIPTPSLSDFGRFGSEPEPIFEPVFNVKPLPNKEFLTKIR